MTIFDNRRTLWMWEFGAQAEADIAAVARTARDLAGADLVLVKAMEGLDWMSAFDHSPTTPASAADWRQLVADGATAGITVVPWVVPHGTDPAAEAAAHARLGPTLVIDAEPYSGFWTAPPERFPEYLQALRTAGVVEIAVSIDPRQPALDALAVVTWVRQTQALLPQIYFTDFHTPALSVIPMIRELQQYGVPVIPVLPGNGSAQDLADVWTLAQTSGCPGVSVWRLGSMDRAQLQAFAALALPASDKHGPETAGEAARKAAALQWRIDTGTKTLEGALKLLAGDAGAAAADLQLTLNDITALAQALASQPAEA